MLALASPVVFGRATGVKRVAMEFAASWTSRSSGSSRRRRCSRRSAISRCQLELVEKLYYGAEADGRTEQEPRAACPKVAIRLLEHIPRLEPVLQILTALNWTDEQITRLGDGTIGLATRVLGLTLEYDALIARGHSMDIVVQTLAHPRVTLRQRL